MRERESDGKTRKETAGSMSTTHRRQLTTFLLVLGAVVFGMVLAGGLNLTVPGMTDDAATNLSATQVAGANSPITSLPSFADLAQAVDPAVVSIQAATIETRAQRRGVDPVRILLRSAPARPGRSAAGGRGRRRRSAWAPGAAGSRRPGRRALPLRLGRQRLRHQPRRPGGHQLPRHRGRQRGQGPPRRPRLHGRGQGHRPGDRHRPAQDQRGPATCATWSSATAKTCASATG